MKQFNLEEYLKNPSKKIITRDGRNVRIICTDAKSNYPIIALIKEQYNNYNDKEEIYTFTENGLWELSPNKGLNDLFFAPEKHREGWVNIYRNKTNGESYCGKIYESEEEAKAQTDILTTIKIEWEE